MGTGLDLFLCKEFLEKYFFLLEVRLEKGHLLALQFHPNRKKLNPNSKLYLIIKEPQLPSELATPLVNTDEENPSHIPPSAERFNKMWSNFFVISQQRVTRKQRCYEFGK